MRGVALSVSKDFQHWTPKKTILTTDEKDGYPWTQTYSMAVTAYGDQLIGLLSLIHLDRIPGNNSLGDMDLQLTVSRDGRKWKRVADRAVFLSPTKGTWDKGRIMSPATTLVIKDDQIYVYYTGVRSRHGEGWDRPAIGVATLPADRFVAMRPQDTTKEGILETKPFRFQGGKLRVNADMSAEDLRVELLDKSGEVIPGFERQNSRLVRSDKLRFEVSWASANETNSLKKLAQNRSIAVRFILRRGSLFSFQITD